MVDNTIALQVKPPQVSDLSTTLLRAYQIKNAQTQNDLSGMQLEAAKQRQGALSDYSMRAKSGDPRAQEALVGQPDLMAQVFQNMTAEREQRIRRIGDAASAAYPLRGKPEFAAEWRRQMDGLYKSGDIPEETYRQWRDNPSELALSQALAMSKGLETYMKTEGQGRANEIVSAIAPFLSAAGGAASKVDQYAANVISGESDGRNLPPPATIPGQPVQTQTGVMQFKKGTWNDLITKYPDLGLTPEDINKPEKQIIAEPRFRRDNAVILAGADIVPTDRNLYMAHFLGGNGAKRFLTGMAENPDRPAVDLVDKAAADANRSVFYSPGGKPLTARQVYENQTSRFGNGMAGVAALAPQLSAGPGANMSDNERLAAAAPMLSIAALKLAAVPGQDEIRKTLLEISKMGYQAGQPTEKEKDYKSYEREQIALGKVPLDRMTWRTTIAREGATRVSIDQRAETTLEQLRGKGLGERLNKIADAGDEATKDREVIGRLGALLEQSGTGSGVAFVNFVREKTGIALNETAGPAEAANAMINYLKPRMRVAGSGASSDRDMDAFAKAMPSLLSTPEGRRLSTETLGGMYSWMAGRGEIATKWQTGQIPAREAVSQMNELPDPFTQFRSWQEKQGGRSGAQAPQRPIFNTPADVDAAVKAGKVKPGEKFIIGSGPKQGQEGTVPGAVAAPSESQAP